MMNKTGRIVTWRLRSRAAPKRTLRMPTASCSSRPRRGVSTTTSSSASAARVSMPAGLICNTPLVESRTLSAAVGSRVLLKIEALQPSGSFKDRGMAFMCASLQRNGATKIVSSSGGNAGHAAATMGRLLGLNVHVVVPKTTKPIMLDRIRMQGAQVQVHGSNWNEADLVARDIVAQDPSAEYVSPYDHPLLWEGHSSLIDEIVDAGVIPGTVVASVGGGGLLNGVYLGLRRHGLNHVRVISAETEGANCFAAAMSAGKTTKLAAITSVATSLGALQCSDESLRLAQTQPTEVGTVTDAEAVQASADFLQDHRLLVEPACGAALSLLTAQRYRHLFEKQSAPIVVVVCGGGGVSWHIMEEWREQGLWRSKTRGQEQ